MNVTYFLIEKYCKSFIAKWDVVKGNLKQYKMRIILLQSNIQHLHLQQEHII